MSEAVRVGCSGWSYDAWRGGSTRRGRRERWLEFYAARFDTVEVNTRFYRFPTLAMSAPGRPGADGFSSPSRRAAT